MISIPQHVTDILTNQTNENPNDIPFKVMTTSDKTIYLWFGTKNTGFIVEGNDWLHKNMAEASAYDHNKIIPFKTLPLQSIKLENVHIYGDYSLSWTENGQSNTASPAECKAKLTEWADTLINSANKPLMRLTLRSSSLQKMAAALKVLITQLP